MRDVIVVQSIPALKVRAALISSVGSIVKLEPIDMQDTTKFRRWSVGSAGPHISRSRGANNLAGSTSGAGRP